MEQDKLNYPIYKTEGVNRTQTMRFYPFVFTGKEKDEETGFGYLPHQARQAHHGARYMDHELMTMWLSVDPMADKYPSMSPYNYCMWNPIKLVDPDGCSGVPSTNKRTKTITITSKLYFYGPQATPELSRAIATGIASQWNAAGATYELNGETYKVRFRIFYETVTEATARRLAKNNTDPKNNFIKVERGPKGKSSYTKMHDGISGYGGNSFGFNTRDDLENSTTPSHEYGHGLGLYHPTEDHSNSTDRPDIMIPRNTPYGTRWSMENGDGERVVNPNSRRVSPQNVQDAIDYGCGDVNNIIIN
ncbi:MAG: hypothetical protein J6X58_06595 [Bacteroidales bacterium]|nr:hypothetical protein [Bacteroidales bacterium]